MPELSSLGPLRVTAWRPGRRVQVATMLAIGSIEIPAPEEPRVLLVPENVASLQQMWDSIRMPTRNNLLVTGESGSGKTLLVRYLGEIYRQASLAVSAELQDPRAAAHAKARAEAFQIRVLTFHENLRRSDITERRHYGETGEEKTGWTMSDVMDGMVAGDWNLLSEINRTGEDVQAEFNEPLENKAKTLHQRVIRGHPDSRFIATVNPVKSEGRGIYEGKVMSGEFVNRFTNKVHLRYLPADQEFEVLKSYGPAVDDALIDRLIAVASDIRRDYAEEHGVVPFPVTTRGLIRMVRHLDQFPSDTRQLRSLFWRKAYWLDDRIHPPIARKLVADLLDLYDITDSDQESRQRSVIENDHSGRAYLRIGAASHPIGPGGPYVPDTIIEEVQQNLADLEWILKDIMLGENILLIGEAGVGKNKLESYLAHLLNYNLLVIGMSGETRVSDLLTYRSFGEEEAGKTGDTATLGLKALTDSDFGWIIVLDEANKAHPGVLVSFNDLLQDRLVRLPGGNVVPIRSSIFVNINPNRPPYEVNDFSFEFMDRFSIHTILHLPAGQAAEVLKKKYPGADTDFVSDVVRGYYSLHPLYSSGILFEPVTMRNEEAAIERGLQHPDRACNLIDLLTACYGPKNGRELHAIRGALESAGFDRNTLSTAGALKRYQADWEADKGDEQKAIALVETYRAIGKPAAARDVIGKMLGYYPGRDWLYRLMNARILLETGDASGAEEEVRRGFREGEVLAMENGMSYAVLSSEVRNTSGSLRISIEAANARTGDNTLIASLPDSPVHTLRRIDGDYSLTSSDRTNGLAIYERIQNSGASEPLIAPLVEENDTVRGSPERLSERIRDLVLRSGAGRGFRQQMCRLPSPPFSPIERVNGTIKRTIMDGEMQLCMVARKDGSWIIEWTVKGKMVKRAEWDAAGGEFSLNSRGRHLRVPLVEDPFVGLSYARRANALSLLLADHIASSGGNDWDWGNAGGETEQLSFFPAGQYRSLIIIPLLEELAPRLQRIFRYSRPLGGYLSPGSGDITYTLSPGTGTITITLLLDSDGFGPSYLEISPEPFRVVTGSEPSSSERMILPFPLVDACEEWYVRAISGDTQRNIREIRKYAAAALFTSTQPRDIGFEARAREILADVAKGAEPVRKETILRRGDILIRNFPGEKDPSPARSVFIVRFIQEGGSGGLAEQDPVVRGFWIAEPHPVATEDLSRIPGAFKRIIVEGDNRYDRIIQHLLAACQESGYPFLYQRTGPTHDPVITLEYRGFSLRYRPMERRFGFSLGGGDDRDPFTFVLEGYPVDLMTASAGNREVIRWQGLPLIDIRILRDEECLLIVLEDAFLDAMGETGFIRDEAPPAPGTIPSRFLPGSQLR